MNQLPPLFSITSLNKEGIGKASWQKPDGTSREVLALYSLPNETISAYPYKYKKKLFAVPDSIVTHSPDRVAPKCIHFGSCGGCLLQHMQYDVQKNHKARFIAELFQGYSAPILPIISSDEIWQYRNKMEWSFSQNAKGEKFLGLCLRHKKGKVQNTLECHLVLPWMQEALSSVRTWWQTTDLQAFCHHKNRGSLRTLTFRQAHCSGDRVIILTVSGDPEYAIKRDALKTFVAACMPHAADVGALIVILRIHQQIKGKPTQFYEMRLHGPDTFSESYEVMLNGQKVCREVQVSPSSFLQPNSFLANTIYTKALELAALSKSDVLYDLYAGIGIFGMLAAPFVKEVIAVEVSPDACFDAKTNASRLKIDNFSIFQGDVKALLAKQDFVHPDVVIVDPPRCGLGTKVCEELVCLKPDRIVYVSCNPETQKVDAELLIEKGYVLKEVQPIDQFPHTPHMENIILLKRNYDIL